jgi:predicted dehydrogenase
VRIGVCRLLLYDPDRDLAARIAEEVRGHLVHSEEEGLSLGADCVVVANPTHLHLGSALQATRAGCHLFVEKPLGHSEEGIDVLCEEVERRGLVSLVGCNMRFHPGPARVKELIEAGELGRVIFGRFVTGSYLPEWRPGTDYRFTYSARADMGGGCLLDCVHEIDLARWCLGAVEAVTAMVGSLGGLEADVEDVAALICRHRGGAFSEIHLDYLQRIPERGCRVVGEKGAATWDLETGQVRWYSSNRQWRTHRPSEGWALNQMYLDEMRHFLICVERGQSTCCPVAEGAAVTRIALAAREAAGKGVVLEVAG